MNKLLLILAIKIVPELAISALFINYYCQEEKKVIDIKVTQFSDESKAIYHGKFLNLADFKTKQKIKSLGLNLDKYLRYVIETFENLNSMDYAEF